MFAKEDIQKAEEVREQFKAAIKPFFPTMGQVVSLANETRAMMREENWSRRQAASRARRKQGTKAYKFSRKHTR